LRIASVVEAVARIPDGATVAVDGFTVMGVAEALYEGIENSFRETGHPRDLVIVHAAGQSNRKIGFEHFAVEGLAKRIVGSHWGLMPRMSAFLGQGLAEAVCLPQGQLSSLYRAIAAGRPGNLTRIGLGTFVDPRIEGGKVNQPARDHAPDYVSIERISGQEFMLYRSFKIDVGIFRGLHVIGADRYAQFGAERPRPFFMRDGSSRESGRQESAFQQRLQQDTSHLAGTQYRHFLA